MANTLSERIPVSGKNNDLDRLAMTLNRMLERHRAREVFGASGNIYRPPD